ncbi:hypothetical protein ACM61V_09755 [Sphingomonas sp. TX0543]|uniref:hypothetical protein n=1 Tax=unclassified Sphingomonas TaxID=196159 RepID=UPI0010F51E33|nr:hypothetical protein [Sphingomonas sp. 3P27F8]
MSETADQAATRRRWITLAELLAVVGMLIGAATLYLNWSGRRADEAARAAQEASAEHARGVVTLVGKVSGGGDALALSDGDRVFSAATVTFPKALGVAPQDALPGPRIAGDWFAAGLLKAIEGVDKDHGRLPVLISVSWWDGDRSHTETALYDILWRTEGRFLRGRKLVLTGLALTSRSKSATVLDAAWERTRPKK